MVFENDIAAFYIDARRNNIDTRIGTFLRRVIASTFRPRIPAGEAAVRDRQGEGRGEIQRPKSDSTGASRQDCGPEGRWHPPDRYCAATRHRQGVGLPDIGNLDPSNGSLALARRFRHRQTRGIAQIGTGR
jgi:hypothetical protein